VAGDQNRGGARCDAQRVAGGQGVAFDEPGHTVMSADRGAQNGGAVAQRKRHRDAVEIAVFHKERHHPDRRRLDRGQRVTHRRGAVQQRDFHLCEPSSLAQPRGMPAHRAARIRIARRSVADQQQGVVRGQT